MVTLGLFAHLKTLYWAAAAAPRTADRRRFVDFLLDTVQCGGGGGGEGGGDTSSFVHIDWLKGARRSQNPLGGGED